MTTNEYSIQQNTQTLLDAIISIKKVEQDISNALVNLIKDTDETDDISEVNKLITEQNGEMYERTGSVLEFIKDLLYRVIDENIKNTLGV